jgi:hypothetical protein
VKWIVAALLILPAVAYGQPRLTADASVGLASGNGGEYQMHDMAFWRLDIDGGIVKVAGGQLLLRISTDVMYHRGDFLDFCVLGSQGQCVPEYPKVSGFALGVGARRTFGGVVTFTGSIARGRYTFDRNGRSTGASGTTKGWLASGDGSFEINEPISLVFGVSKMYDAHINGEVLGYDAFTLGIRVGLP